MPSISGTLKSTYTIYGPATAYAPFGWDGSQYPLNGVVFSDAMDGAVFFYTCINGVHYGGSGLVPRYFATEGEVYPYTLTWDNVNGLASVTIKGVTYGPIPAPVLAENALSVIIIGPDNYTTPPEPTQGTLTVRTTPTANVYVNGAPWGFTPQSRQLNPGPYTVTFEELLGYYPMPSAQAQVAIGAETVVDRTYVVKTIQPDLMPLLLGAGGGMVSLGAIAYMASKKKNRGSRALLGALLGAGLGGGAAYFYTKTQP